MMRAGIRSETAVEWQITRLAAILGLLIALSIPAIYTYAAISYETDRIQAKAEDAAAHASAVIYKNPQMWMYMGDRFIGALEPLRISTPHAFHVIDMTGNHILSKEEPLSRFWITGVAQLYDGHLNVGSVSYSESVMNVFWRSLLAAILGLMLGGTTFVILKILPMRALRTALADLQKANAEVNATNINLEELVARRTSKIEQQAKQLEEALGREKELNELQRQFVAMVSHEFRTPLAIIDSTAQRLSRRASKDALTSQEAIERVNKIRDAVKRMARLMESILTAARMESGKIGVEIGPCNVEMVVRDVCSRQQELSKRHIISYDLAGLPANIEADPAALEQVFTNLLSNAVKYAPGAQKIDVVGQCRGDCVEISVRDYGLGIDEEDLPKMFERFFRARTSSGITGTGIGMNLARTLVEMHGGSIHVESRKDEGSLFTVSLPITQSNQDQLENDRAA